jgi:hypothetical protein
MRGDPPSDGANRDERQRGAGGRHRGVRGIRRNASQDGRVNDDCRNDHQRDTQNAATRLRCPQGEEQNSTLQDHHDGAACRRPPHHRGRGE